MGISFVNLLIISLIHSLITLAGIYLNYRSSKKSQKDIELEIKKNSAEIENLKQLATWNNTLPQTNEYMQLVGIKRCGNVGAIPELIRTIENDIESGLLVQEDMLEIRDLLNKIQIPSEKEEIYPHEIPSILAYKKLQRKVDSMIQKSQE